MCEFDKTPPRRGSRATRVFSLLLALTVAGTAPTALAAPAHADSPVEATACGTPLTSAEVATIATLSEVGVPPGAPSLAGLASLVERHAQITAILLRHNDWRGLFSVGLDAVENEVVLPLQRDPAAFADRAWAVAVSTDLLSRYLRNVHAAFTGTVVEPQWQRFFALAGQCDSSPALVAMAGYNAHLTVDLARSVADAGTRPEHVAGFYRIVDAIALGGDVIVERTRTAYGADLGPLWRGYVVGDFLDALAGEGVGSGALLRLADNGYNTITLAHGLALQEPALQAEATRSIDDLWRFADTALVVLADVGGL
jgi:hypothetical protein